MKSLKNSVLSLIIFLSLFCLVGNAFASSTIKLGGGKILPTNKITIALDKLVIGALYNVTCNISNPTNDAIVMGVSSDRYPPFYAKYLNDQRVYSQGSLNPGLNTLLIINVENLKLHSQFGGQNLVLTNTDHEHAVMVENCFATAIPNY